MKTSRNVQDVLSICDRCGGGAMRGRDPGVVSNSYFLSGTKSVTSSLSKRRTGQCNLPDALSAFRLIEVERERMELSKGYGERRPRQVRKHNRRVPELT